MILLRRAGYRIRRTAHNIAENVTCRSKLNTIRECKVAYLAFAQFFSDDHWAIKLKAFDRILNCPVKLLGVKQRLPMYSSAPVFGTLFAAANLASGQNHQRAKRARETNT
jgi:hypothetical protein